MTTKTNGEAKISSKFEKAMEEKGIKITGGKTLKKALDQAKVVIPEAEKIKIMSATLKEGYGEYEYEIIEGKGTGDTLKRKGAGLITHDMERAFQKLAVHLAFFSDIFTHKEIEVKDINKFHNHAVTSMCTVEGFKIKGGEGDEQVILMGTISTTFGWMDGIKTSPIPIENMPSYNFYKELKGVITECRNEVLLYKEGKHIAEEKAEDPKQAKIQDAIDEAEEKE